MLLLIEPIDDLEDLTIVKEWINEHDGMIPNRNSFNKQEQHYYAILRRIQSKYSKYLDGFDNFKDLTDEDKTRIEEIIELATEIDLWNIELPSIPKTRGSKEEFELFSIEGVLRDFVEFEEEINDIEGRTKIAEFIEIAEKLNNSGIEVGKLPQGRRVNNKDVPNTLQDLVEQGKIPKEVLNVLGLYGKYRLGYYIVVAKKAYNEYGHNVITEEEKRKLEKLGIIRRLDEEYKPKRKSRTAKEIAEGSIISLNDIEMSDREDKELKALIERTKKGGIKTDE